MCVRNIPQPGSHGKGKMRGMVMKMVMACDGGKGDDGGGNDTADDDDDDCDANDIADADNYILDADD